MAGGLQRRTAKMSWLQRLRITSSLLSRARCKNHLRSRSVSGEMPAVSPVAGSHSGDDDPSMCSQKRMVFPPAAAMSRRAPSRIAWSSAGVCVYWLALEKGRNLTLPRLTPSMKKGLPSRVVTRLPTALGSALAAAAAGVTGIGAAATCSISATSEEAAPFLAARKLLGGGELAFFARAGVEKAPAERPSRARTSTAAAEEKSLRRRSIASRFFFRRLSFALSAFFFSLFQSREILKLRVNLCVEKGKSAFRLRLIIGEKERKEEEESGERAREREREMKLKQPCPCEFGASNVPLDSALRGPFCFFSPFETTKQTIQLCATQRDSQAKPRRASDIVEESVQTASTGMPTLLSLSLSPLCLSLSLSLFFFFLHSSWFLEGAFFLGRKRL